MPYCPSVVPDADKTAGTRISIGEYPDLSLLSHICLENRIYQIGSRLLNVLMPVVGVDFTL